MLSPAVWERRPGGFGRKRGLLVLDAFRCHTQPEIKQRLAKGNTDIAIIPGGMTSMVQPLDVSINKPFKGLVREKWNNWLDHGEKAVTATGRFRKPELSTMANWILEAWNDIPEGMIIKSFKKCCITNALDGTEDNLMYEDEDELNQLNAEIDAERMEELRIVFSEDESDEEFVGFYV